MASASCRAEAVKDQSTYVNGSWSIDLKGLPLAAGSRFRPVISMLMEARLDPWASSGASGITIYSFSVQQQGQNISIVDNNGSTYEGNFGSIRSTGGADQDNQSTPATR